MAAQSGICVICEICGSEVIAQKHVYAVCGAGDKVRAVYRKAAELGLISTVCDISPQGQL